jgi:hypothetical protein
VTTLAVIGDVSGVDERVSQRIGEVGELAKILIVA